MTTQASVDLDAAVAALTQKLSDVRKSRARADAELDAATANRDGVLKTLALEFNVASPDEAKAVLAQLEADLAREIEALQQALKMMEGEG
jgi:hypothetical protein